MDTPRVPLIVLLHGAGRNDLDIRKVLPDPKGGHAGHIPRLIECGQAPSVLLKNFAALAPYASGRASFYPRSQLLKCIELAKSKLSFDPHQKFWFGFSHGATVAVELMTTRRFAGAVVCRDGYTGRSLPTHTRERLVGLPIWVFSSADDGIFSVRIFSKTDGLIGRGILQISCYAFCLLLRSAVVGISPGPWNDAYQASVSFLPVSFYPFNSENILSVRK